MHLHRNPRWKSLASLETEEVLGSKDYVDLNDLSRLKVVSNCLKEALRLTPPAPFTFKQTVNDFVIPHDQDQVTDSLHAHDEERGVPFMPPSPFIEPCSNRQAGKTIPAGCRIGITIFAMHRHPLLWSNGDKFLPDRWAAKAKETTTPLAFIPFSIGSRNCIGQVFSQMEAKIILARFLRAFDFDLVHDGEHDQYIESLTLHFRHGLKVKLRNRN